jgi:hypothetical protein
MDTKKSAGIVVIILLFAFYIPVPRPGGICIAASVEFDIKKMTDDLNKQLPLQIDDVTRCDRVEAGSGKSYSYIYTLGKSLNDSEKQQIQDTVTQQALGNPGMQSIFNAGVTVWYKYYDPAGNKVLEFSVKDKNLSKQDLAYNYAYKIGYYTGVFGGDLLVGVVCGIIPLFLGIRRGRSKLAFTALAACLIGGLLLGLLLAVPVAVIFIVVILAMPRVVPASIVLEAKVLEQPTPIGHSN